MGNAKAKTLGVEYNVAGLAKRVTADGQTRALYGYNVLGKRQYKEVRQEDGTLKKSWYVQDGNGQLMTIYEQEGNTPIQMVELPIYGASRLGSKHYLGDYEWEDRYEHKDHLGNVRVTYRRGQPDERHYSNMNVAESQIGLRKFLGFNNRRYTTANSLDKKVNRSVDPSSPTSIRLKNDNARPYFLQPVHQGKNVSSSVYYYTEEPSNEQIEELEANAMGSNMMSVMKTPLINLHIPNATSP